MPRLYIGNPTRQIIEFSFRVPDTENFPLQTQRIGIGGQIEVSGNLNMPQIDGIIHQHQAYGITPVAEVDRMRKYIPLLYSVDAPIPAAKLARALEHNQAILAMRGKELRTQAAVAEAVHLESTLRESGVPGALRTLESSVMEEAPQINDGMFAEGTRVSRLFAPDGSPLASARNKGRRKAA